MNEKVRIIRRVLNENSLKGCHPRKTPLKVKYVKDRLKFPLDLYS